MKQYGLIIPEITEDNYILGGITKLKGATINPEGNWTPYLPPEELQAKRSVDTNGCVTFGTLNCLETLERKLIGNNPNYSDRVIFIASDTTPTGNDPHKVAETIRKKQGLVREEMLPFSEDLDTWEKYKSPNPLPKNFYDEGQKWWDTWEFGHEWVWGVFETQEGKRNQLKDALTKGTVAISVQAWYERDGKYYSPGGRHNHWTQLVGYKEGEYWEVFDSYAPHIKHLEWEYDFLIAKVFYLRDVQIKLSLLQKIINLLAQIIQIQIDKKKPTVQPESIKELPESKPELPKYEWNTPEKAKHSVRVICDEQGLTWDQKNLITAVIQTESGFNIKAVNRNTNGSTDWGICQFNDGPPSSTQKWWIGKGCDFNSIDEVLNDPEKCVRVMIREYKKGNLRLWIAYKSGAYKRYLQSRSLGGITTMFKLLESSDGTGRISGRVSSTLVGLIPAIILIGKVLGYDILQTEVQGGVDLFVQLIVYAEGLVALFWHVNAWAERNFRKENKLGAFSE